MIKKQYENDKSLRWVQDPDIQKRKRDNAILDVSDLLTYKNNLRLHVETSLNLQEKQPLEAIIIQFNNVNMRKLNF